MIDLVDLSLLEITLDVRKVIAHVPRASLPLELPTNCMKLKFDGNDVALSWKKFVVSASREMWKRYQGKSSHNNLINLFSFVQEFETDSTEKQELIKRGES